MSKQRKLTIWVDGDACPGTIKNILFRAAERKKIPLVLVANKPMRVPDSDFISTQIVSAGFDAADEKIVAEIREGDLVVTADIPFAAEAVEKGAEVLDHRGSFFTEENIRERLSLRNFMADLRETGIQTGGPSAFGQKDSQQFANQLDRFLTKHLD